MSRLPIAGGVVATIGALAAGSVALGWPGQDRGNAGAAASDNPRRTQTGREARPAAEARKGEEAPSIAGRWSVLYIAGSVAGKREGYAEPNLLVPITEGTINLPMLTANDRDPIHYGGTMEYTIDWKDDYGVVTMKTRPGSGGPQKQMRGICRVGGDNVVLCYDTEGGTVPAQFAAARDTEIVLVLRPGREKTTRPPDGTLPPPTGPIR